MSWRTLSLDRGGAEVWIIGLLVGFLLGNSLTDLLSDAVDGRTFHALMTLIGCELLVALRRRFLTTPVALYWRLLDNLRFGFVYAVVLEAFSWILTANAIFQRSISSVC